MSFANEKNVEVLAPKTGFGSLYVFFSSWMWSVRFFITRMWSVN